MHRPPVVNDGDQIDFRVTREDEYRIPYTFIEALNEGTLFDRPPDVFQSAARDRRLFHVLNRSTDNIIGTALVQEAQPDANGHRSAEVGGMMMHPVARGFGIATLLLQVVMVRQPSVRRRNGDEEALVAHVIDGNQGPVHALLSAGFKDAGPVIVHQGEVDAAITHMIPAGASGVPMHGYRYDPAALDQLIHALWRFVYEGHSLLGDDARGRAKVDFSDMLDPTWLEAEVERPRTQGPPIASPGRSP